MSSNGSLSKEAFPVYVLCAMVFLLPLFFVPTVIEPFLFGKALVFYLLTTLSLLVWLFIRLQDETLEIPKSSLLLTFGGVTLVTLVSSIFSMSPAASFVGTGMEIGTFSFFLGLSVVMFLFSIFFQTEKKVLMIYFSIFVSATIAFIYQLLHTVFKINIPGFGLLSGPTSSLLGGWSDFGIFFGFVGIVALSLFELVKLEKKFKIFVLFLIGASLLSMLVVNLSLLWFVFGFFTLILMVYLFSGPALENAEDSAFGGGKKSKGFLRLSLFVTLLIIFFIVGNKLVVTIVNSLGTNLLDVRPSWSATLDITKGVYGESIKNIILGSGPTTFVYDWAKFKPAFVNSTVFWNTQFNSGAGQIPSMVASMGLLGVAAIVAFLFFLIYYGGKVLSYSQNNLLRGLLFSSYLGAIYLWTFNVLYSPGAWVFIMASAMTGLFVGLLAHTGKIDVIRMSFLKNQKTRFVYVLVVVLFILGSVYSISVLTQKAIAVQVFASGVAEFNKTGDLAKVETKLNQAVQLDPQDRYYRTLSEFYLNKMQSLSTQGNVPKERQSMDMQKALGDAIDSAKAAVNLNNQDASNWLQLGRVYESLASLKIAGADKPAADAYNMAIKLVPSDPSNFLALARLELLGGRVDGAKSFIQQSLNAKPDFVQALYLDAQIEVQQGNLKGAITRGEQIVAINPNDVGSLFQLGLLYYQAKNFDNAMLALERAVGINPYYSNARYFLGLIYDNKGRRQDAIDQFQKIKDLNPDNAEVQKIIDNLNSGKPALDTVSPPAPAPDKRTTPPVQDTGSKGSKNKLGN